MKMLAIMETDSLYNMFPYSNNNFRLSVQKWILLFRSDFASFSSKQNSKIVSFSETPLSNFLWKQTFYLSKKNYKVIFWFNLKYKYKNQMQRNVLFFLQSSYADYIYSFAVKNVQGLHKGEGAYLNACFWVRFVFKLDNWKQKEITDQLVLRFQMSLELLNW